MSVPRKACALLGLSLALHATANDKPSAYAYTMPLTLAADTGIASLRLPQAVYIGAMSRDLSDMRVFDRDGNPRPHAIVPPERKAQTRVDDIPARVFPLNGAWRGQPGGLWLDVRVDAQGCALAVATRGAGREREGLSGLILDLGGIRDDSRDGAIHALRFEPPHGTSSYTAELQLETSDDLQRWEPAATAELHWIVNSDEQTLSNNRMEFAPRRFRYARLSWRRGKPLVFAGVVAESGKVVEAAPVMETLSLKPRPVRKELLYEASMAIPVERIGLRFDETNVVYPADVGSYLQTYRHGLRRQTAPSFRPVASSTFYRVRHDGAERISRPIPVGEAHAAQWIVRPHVETNAQPTLQLSWTPATLLFLANGKGPYRLAFGKTDARRTGLAPEQVAPGFTTEELNRLPQAMAGALAPRPGLRHAGLSRAGGDIVLWTVLLTGVALLAFFALKLLRQIKVS
ncbi:DUF3999 family protein [Pseudoduganella namucuonensis]|uniref:DUF3999 family protein n=1 Tax=Pseudoduganella namucuonensis TaxID=1035707 RepID=A0A1I7IXN8_9BURK|nr:DUF3999 family protein [Pseudoduganella namucuonensis]SFU77707.1 Protein of unknown function [Pseudoduganella namucuonensis]